MTQIKAEVFNKLIGVKDNYEKERTSMTNVVKEKIEQLAAKERDYAFYYQDYPDHQKAMETIIDSLEIELPDDYQDFTITEEEMAIDSDGFPYIHFTVVYPDGTEIEMTAFHDARWYYYARLYK